MLLNLMYGCAAMALCLILQSIMAVKTLTYYRSRVEARDSHGDFFFMRVIIFVMLALVIGNFLQVVIWGGLFCFLGEFENLSTAIYHSAVNFATLGYGDIVMSEEHRLLGPLESINGVLMIGFSTAVLMGVIQDCLQRELGIAPDTAISRNQIDPSDSN